ncbi:MAG: cation transporting ATPase C-terminal domain-containing protein, partial [Deltaproteobacteria bacterium]|nr:cation transporting ATPase C-terminal domain-containing protein [Deltaproteobacteria bacterium]
NCRSLHLSIFKLKPFGNMFLIAGVLTMSVLQLLFVYAPFMNKAFHSAPIALRDWFYIIGIGLAIMFIIEIEKGIRNNFRSNKKTKVKYMNAPPKEDERVEIQK